MGRLCEGAPHATIGGLEEIPKALRVCVNLHNHTSAAVREDLVSINRLNSYSELKLMQYKKLYGLFIEKDGIYYSESVNGVFSNTEGKLFMAPPDTYQGSFAVRLTAQKGIIPITMVGIEMKNKIFYFSQPGGVYAKYRNSRNQN